jgi:hypothetical protein
VSVQALPGAGYDRGPRIRAVRAKADAFVSGVKPLRNFGHARALMLDSSPALHAYVRFNADLSSGDVQHVSLLVYSRTRSRLGYRVRLVDEGWRERRITYRNAPPSIPGYVMSGPLRARAWKAVDVTDLVTYENHKASFALTTVSTKGLELASRETGLYGPRLVVETDEQSTTTTTATTTSD